jgi:hypothetical protein
MTFQGFDLTPLLSGLIIVIGALLTRVAGKLAAAKEQDAAWAKLANVGLAIAGDVWTAMSADLQAAIADGKITSAERDALKRAAMEQVARFTSSDELAKIATALGLPLPTVIGWVGEYLIDRFTKAHDPVVTTVSAGAYPVTTTATDAPASAHEGP